MSVEESVLAAKEESFRETVAEIATKDRRRQRISLVLTMVMVVTAGCWLVFSALQVQKLSEQSHELETAKSRLENEIRADTEILVALNPLLSNFGWSSKKIPKNIKDVTQVTQSLEANEKLNQLRLELRQPSAEKIVVQYYPKDVDGNKVRSALADFGFRVEERTPLVTDVPADDIVFGEKVPPENAKIVAYVLIRAGVEIKGIHRSRLPIKANVIQVIANRIVAEQPPLSVEDIRRQSHFDLDPIYDSR